MSEAEGQRRMSAGQPIFVLNEDSERTHGKEAQEANIEAGKAIAEAVRTTLGPNGMDKMLVSDGDVVVTNDGATILDEMDIEHPAAKMIAEVSQTQEEEVGDGTTTAAVLTGELLTEIEDLIDQDVHPTTIVRGYTQAREIALETIADLTETDLDDDLLKQVAVSSMTGKGTGGATADLLAESIVQAVRSVQTDAGVDRDAIGVLTQTGRSSAATELVDGVAFREEPARDDMPRRIEDATVALVDDQIDHPDVEADVEYAVDSADQLSQAVAAEEQRLQELSDALLEADVDVAFVGSSVADEVAGRLAGEGVLVFDDVVSDDVDAVRRSTGANVVHNVEHLETDDLGTAETVRRETVDDELVFVEGDGDEAGVTLFVRGGTGHVIDELERAVDDGIDVVASAIDSGVVPGAGTTETVIAAAVRETAAGIEGREQLAVEAFADAMEALPRTLASNAGMDPIDALVDLRAANESGRAGVIGTGVNASIDDPIGAGVLDPAEVKREAVESATESATMIVRIDDVISAE